MAWLLLLLLVAVGGTYGILWLTTPPPGLTEENARRLRAGMTMEHVERLFGVPGREVEGFVGEQRYIWGNDKEFNVLVIFDEAGLLSSARLPRYPSVWSEIIDVNTSFLDTLRRMLRL